MVKFWVFFCTLSLMGAFTAYVLLTGNTPISFEDIESNFAPWVNDSGKVGTYYAAEPLDTSHPVASNTGSKLNGTLELVSATSPTELSMWTIMFISFIVLLLYAMFALSVIGFYLMNSRGWTKHVEIPHKTMPSLIFAAVMDDNSTSSTCAVCFEDYIVGEKLRVLPCHHKFHANCVDPWLISWRTICPVCKLDVSAPQRNMLQDLNMEETAEQIIFNLQFKVSSLVRHYFLFQILLFCVIMRVPSKVLCQYTWFLFILSLVASIRAVYILVKMVLELIERGGEIDTMRSIDDRITWYWKMWRFSLGTMFMSLIICIAVLMLYATWVIPCCGTLTTMDERFYDDNVNGVVQLA